ncbi:MAG: alpha-amylase [Lachnospiraceae bacterium]|nr:alpha-amylase [Lachnospiraceae bacterium]
MDKNWINEAVFYHIYPLGFTGAPKYNEGQKTSGNRIRKVLEWIPHLKELGINAIYFGPIFQSVSHGYDTSNYYITDSRLGNIEDFKEVFSVLHDNGIRIVLDGVFNHVGRGFWAFNDVQQNLELSRYKEWFYHLDFTQESPAGDKFTYEMWEGNSDLVKLNLKNPEVYNHLLGAVKMWIEEFDIDGLRLDAADCVDKDFFRQLRDFTKDIKKDFWLMGEIIHGDYKEWANNEMLNSVTNYECWKGIYSSHNDKNYYEIAYSLNRQFGKNGIYKDLCLYNFLDNHDVNRIGSLLKSEEDIKNAYTLLFLMPGVPSIYYGSEWGIKGEKGTGTNSDDPIRPELDLKELESTNQEIIEHIKKLSCIRKESDAIKYGDYEEILVRNKQFVFARTFNNEQKFVVLNLSEKKEKIVFHYKKKQYEILMQPHSSWIY